ncbi:MAG: hypothetical protein WBH31_15715 [Promethearchaeia archaeon]
MEVVNITIPSSTCNITSMELNFTEVKLSHECATVEDGGESFKIINKLYKGWAVQLNVTDSILLFGVYIYGYLTGNPISPVYVQINGYDKLEDKPNSTLHGEQVPLNMSITPNWYLQSFPDPIPLSKDQYFLVVNGSEYKTSDNSDYHWFLNEIDSNHTNLHIAKFDGSSWSDDGTGKPFRHKLIQRFDKFYSPEDINMSIQIDNQDYPVSDTGNVNITNVNLSTKNENETFFHFPVKHNQTVGIIFNATYSVKLMDIFSQQGSVLIKNNEENLWSTNFTLSRIYNNYSVKFYYPSNWNNLEILRNDVNVTSEVFINSIEHVILITNNSIIDSHNWQIRASSPRTEFDLDLRRSEYNPSQELRFSIDTPAPSGNYTLVLYNADYYEIEDARQTISYPLDDTFSFVLPTHSIEGEYHAYVYFFDGTNAGVETATFLITVPFTIDPITLFLIILASVIAISVTTSIVVVVKKHKRKVEAYKEEIFNKCMDILNINYIMVSEKKSSLNVYEQVFTKQKLDPTLISGFLSAIHSFGIELTNTDEKTQTIKLEYKNSKVLMSEFKGFRIVIIMNKLPSQKFFDSISNLAFDIETQYSRYLENFKGNIDPFKGIENLLKKHLSISFLYPLKIVKTGKTKVSQTEKIMIGRALESMKKNNQQYFYTTHIMEVKACDSKDIEAIFNLIDKNIFQPVI